MHTKEFDCNLDANVYNYLCFFSYKGMMDQAYFVGRAELLDFFNDLLGLQLAKIEQTASGAVACQLTEYIFPGSVPMSRVNWEARSDYEFIANYKLLQNAFTKKHIQRHVDVPKLIRAKYQDNLEFCQWLKAFFDQSGAHREDYDPEAVRARGKGGKKYNTMLQGTANKFGSKAVAPRRNVTRPNATKSTVKSPQRVPISHRTTTTSTKRVPLRDQQNKQQLRSNQEKSQLSKINTELEHKVTELETTLVELEKERDFYFGKLRNVELMLQVQQDKNFEGCDLDGVVESIFKVLYATADEDVDIDDEGDILPVEEPEETSTLDDGLNAATNTTATSVPAQEHEVF
jgi:RP/EB family microtubule-associated protein